AEKVIDLAWYDDERLVLIAKPQDSPLGVYMLDANSLSAQPELLSALSGDTATAHDLQVSPDRLWIPFLLGEGEKATLYRLSKDGGEAEALRPGGKCPASGVSEYGWLEPNMQGGAQRMIVLLNGQAGYLVAYPDAKRAPDCDLLKDSAGS